MAKQTINLGTVAGDGTGDPLRTALDKVNDNFDEVYAANVTASAHIASTSNPHSVTKSQVGLGNVTDHAQLKASDLDTDATFAANSDTKIPSQKAVKSAVDLKLNSSARGANDGVAPLDSSGKVPSANLPSYVDDVIEAANFAALPDTGEAGKIYVTLNDNKTYRWSGSAYAEISATPAFASQAEAEAGSDNAKLMTPLLTAQAIAALAASAPDWGDIGGTLADQTDLQASLDALLPKAGGTVTGQLVITPGFNTVGNTVNGTVTGAGVTRALVQINDDWTGASGGTSAPTTLRLSITDSGGLNYGATTTFNIVRNGSSVFKIDHGGTVTGPSNGYILDPNNLKIQMAVSWRLSWNDDVCLYRDAASCLALRIGAAAQTMRVYGTYTDASNYERLALKTAAGACELITEAAGTGTRRNIMLNGANRAAYDASPSATTVRDILISHGLMAAS